METLADRIALACGDPGSIVPRLPGESTARWSARAVMAVLAEPPRPRTSGPRGGIYWLTEKGREALR